MPHSKVKAEDALWDRVIWLSGDWLLSAHPEPAWPDLSGSKGMSGHMNGAPLKWFDKLTMSGVGPEL